MEADAELAAKLARASEWQERNRALADGALFCESDTLCTKPAKFMDEEGSVYCETCWPEWKGYKG